LRAGEPLAPVTTTVGGLFPFCSKDLANFRNIVERLGLSLKPAEA